MTSIGAMSAEKKAKLEATNYLEDQRRDINSLAKYPLINGLFVRYNSNNADLPSSAAAHDSGDVTVGGKKVGSTSGFGFLVRGEVNRYRLSYL